jgi:hypothetical protein
MVFAEIYIVRYISFSADMRFDSEDGDGHQKRKKAMASKIDEYRAGAVRCEQRAKKTRNQADREWQICLARAYLMLAEAEAERTGALSCRNIRATKAAA